MKINVTIRDRNTDVVRVFADDYDWTDGDHTIVYMYRDGNYSCDCNRSIFFARAVGENGLEQAVECGEGRFVVETITDQSKGRVIYEDSLPAN